MTFNLTLTPAILSDLTKKLSRLATDVRYRPGDPGTLSIDNFDPANKPVIVDIVLPYIPTVRDLPDWSELTRAHGKPLAAIAAKRRLQVGVG